MKFLYLATLLAAANAFTTSPSVISTVGEKSMNNVFADSSAHRTRRATIVMDGKANGKTLRGFCTAQKTSLTYHNEPKKHVLDFNTNSKFPTFRLFTMMILHNDHHTSYIMCSTVI
jgi:hypothetical protein